MQIPTEWGKWRRMSRPDASVGAKLSGRGTLCWLPKKCGFFEAARGVLRFTAAASVKASRNF